MEVSKKDALKLISLPPYKTDEIEKKKIDYFWKKLKWHTMSFIKFFLIYPKHSDYKNDYFIFQFLQFYRKYLNQKM